MGLCRLGPDGGVGHHVSELASLHIWSNALKIGAAMADVAATSIT